MLCGHCQGLTLDKLYHISQGSDLQYLGGSGFTHPENAYYRHQSSYKDLGCSAKAGCSLCRAVQHEFRRINIECDIEEQADNGRSTDVRVFLSSSVPKPEPPLLPIFDELWVQVGDFDLEADPLLSIPFILKRDRRSNFLNSGQIGRHQLEPDLESPQNFQIAEEWLTVCSEKHKESICAPNRHVDLPTRLIDVGLGDGSQSPRLVITKGQIGRYITLSHCWGGQVDLTTTTSTLEDRLKGISMQALPKNFHDAVIIARKLGFRFLWIDSICIIQNCPSDWESESAVMGDYYRNAFLTIAAAGASKSSDGILGIYSEDDGDLDPPIYLKAGSDSSQMDSVALTCKKESEEGLFECVYKSPLAGRAWALQERILSYRVLYYGRRQLYWQCQQARWSADSQPENPATESLFSKLLALSYEEKCSVESFLTSDIYSEWYKILELYCSRRLTKESDKLPALGGLAAQIQKLTGDRYLAGIWFDDIHRAFLWQLDIAPITLRTHRAPSWSWARWDGVLLMHGINLNRIPCDEEMGLLEFKVELCGENEFGEVRSGWLRVSGLIGTIWRSRKEYAARGYPYVGTHLYIIEHNGMARELHHDSLVIDCEKRLENLGLTKRTQEAPLDPQPTYISTNDGDEFTLLFIAKYRGGGPEEDDAWESAYALVLFPVEGRHATFRRGGILSMHIESAVFQGLKNWTLETVTII
ncbi:hypothetical protein GJ744_004213 [Endocarpon pusillum]|uniref:Heterokaryon incompatibility domain-containing protein n=1 Tax=Endocarpon pusillum TaxID=364733 RepID=A0A8H7ADF1_9EURO|nr:hypothetical protein GJ744_004213 [Endocarpon pusillum]